MFGFLRKRKQRDVPDYTADAESLFRKIADDYGLEIERR